MDRPSTAERPDGRLMLFIWGGLSGGIGVGGGFRRGFYWVDLLMDGGRLKPSCEEDKAAMSRTVAELTRDGFVTVDSERKYRAPITLTDKGRLIAKRVDEMVAEAVAAGGNGLTEEERRIFYYALELISENLKKYLKEDSN